MPLNIWMEWNKHLAGFILWKIMCWLRSDYKICKSLSNRQEKENIQFRLCSEEGHLVKKKGRKECRQLKEFKDIGTRGGKSEIKVQV